VRVGVLALQGDVNEHVAVLESLGAQVSRVKTPAALDDVDALVMPGGESTTILRLLDTSGLREPLATRLDEGMATFATCAGLIVLAADVVDGRSDQWSYGALKVGVRRNGYGRQIASFESPLEVRGLGTVPGVFIRAPKIESWSDDVEVLATYGGDDDAHPVLVRQQRVWGASFHPELTGDGRVHRLFLDSL